MGGLCQVLKSPLPKQLRVFCTGSSLWMTEENISASNAHPTVTLQALLQQRTHSRVDIVAPPTVSKKKKKILAVVLATSLFQLFGSPWLQTLWNIGTIYLMHDPATNEIVDIFNPYIMCSVEPIDMGDPGAGVNEQQHIFVYAFGLLLLELELDQRIPVTNEDENEADDEYPPVYMALLRMFDIWKDDLDDPYIQEIINSCLDFENKVEAIKHSQFDEKAKGKAAIFRYIVQPLLQRLKAAHSDVSLDKWCVPAQPVRVRYTPTTRLNAEQSLLGLTSRASTMSNHEEFSLIQHTSSAPPRRQNSQRNWGHAFTGLNSWDSIQPQTRGDFQVVIICALPLEANAVEALFDQRWDRDGNVYGKAWRDRNSYSLGRMGHHNVILAWMPGMGNNSAASVASDCRFSFENIKLALVVGICGGVPFRKNGEEIVLGDVVISEGIVAHDFGRQYPGQFVRKDDPQDRLARPTNEIRTVLAKLKGEQNEMQLRKKTFENLKTLQKGSGLGARADYPGTHRDKLFQRQYRHKHQSSFVCETCSNCKLWNDPVCDACIESTCEELGCHDEMLVSRRRLSDRQELGSMLDDDAIIEPTIHIGRVASGNVVMKSGDERDQIAAKENVIAFEMEGAGIWDNFPCLIIKGVCDYADSHKSKEWQSYAAATAAACAKAFLENWVAGSPTQ